MPAMDPDAVLDLLPDVVIVMDPNGLITYANAATTNLLGWPVDQLVGRSGFDFVHPDEQAEAVERVAEQVAEGAGMKRHHVEIARRGGGYTKFEMLAALAPGRVGSFLLVLRDVSERDEAQKRLHRRDEQLRALTENVPDALGRFDHEAQLVFSIRRFDEVVAANPEVIDLWTGHVHRVLSSGERVDLEHVLAGAGTGSATEAPRWVAVRLVPERDPDGAVSHVLVIASDITDRKQNEQRLFQAATHDPLTGLINRQRFRELAERALGRPGQEGNGSGPDAIRGRVALIFIDLDGFKAVNDGHGHAAGDAVLMAVARRLSEIVRPTDVVARLGGDEFVVLCTDFGDEAPTDLVDRIAMAIGRPIAAGDGQGALSVGASIGLALSEPGGSDFDQLLARADHAMYENKAEYQAKARDPLKAGDQLKGDRSVTPS